jgi:hypothetical protein
MVLQLLMTANHDAIICYRFFFQIRWHHRSLMFYITMYSCLDSLMVSYAQDGRGPWQSDITLHHWGLSPLHEQISEGIKYAIVWKNFIQRLWTIVGWISCNLFCMLMVQEHILGNCTLLVYYTVSSVNLLLMFWDNLLVPSSRAKNYIWPLRWDQLVVPKLR